MAGQDVERGSDKLDLDLVVGSVLLLSGAEGILNSVDSIVAEASNLDIGTDLGGMRGELAADVLLDLALDGVAGECDLIPDGRVTRRRIMLVKPSYHGRQNTESLT